VEGKGKGAHAVGKPDVEHAPPDIGERGRANAFPLQVLSNRRPRNVASARPPAGGDTGRRARWGVAPRR
jgi:hypothetical protein